MWTRPELGVSAARPDTPRPVPNQPPAHANPLPTPPAQGQHSGRPRAAILTSAAGSRRPSDAMAGGWEEVRPGRPIAAPSAGGTEGDSPPPRLSTFGEDARTCVTKTRLGPPYFRSEVRGAAVLRLREVPGMVST